MSQRIPLFLLAIAMLFATTGSALAQESNEGLLGISVGAELGYWSASSVLDSEGESQDEPEFTDSQILAKLNAEYMSSLGLFFGLDIPYVSHTLEVGEREVSGSGIGDISIYAGYVYDLVVANVGVKARVKANTGVGTDMVEGDEASTGGNSTNLQFSIFGSAGFLGAKAYLEAGYLMTLEAELNSADGVTNYVNDGDIIYGDLAFGYALLGMIEPRLHIIFATAGDKEHRTEGGPTEGTNSLDDSGLQWLALAFDLQVHITSLISAHVGYGTPMDAIGYNIPMGFILTGKNIPNGAAMLNAGVQFRF